MVRLSFRNHEGSEFEFYHYHRKTLTTKEIRDMNYLKKITFFKKKARSIVVSSANQEEISIPNTQEYSDLQNKSTIRHLAWDIEAGCLG